MILVDNSALSFAFNVNNGIPILPFYDDKQDEELRHLNYYLNCLRDSAVDDVRHHNDEAFGLLRLQYSSSESSQVIHPNDQGTSQEGHHGSLEPGQEEMRLIGEVERAELSGEYVIRDDEISNHHAMSKDYL